MEPADPKPSSPLPQAQTDCKARGNSSCCQQSNAPDAGCSAVSQSHASAEPAEPQRSQVQAYATVGADATSLPPPAAKDASSDSATSDSSTAHFALDQANPGASTGQQADSNTDGMHNARGHQQQSSEANQCYAAAEASTSSTSSDADGCMSGQIAGYTWRLPAGVQQEDCVMMWVGPQDAAALTHLQLTFNK